MLLKGANKHFLFLPTLGLRTMLFLKYNNINSQRLSKLASVETTRKLDYCNQGITSRHFSRILLNLLSCWSRKWQNQVWKEPHSAFSSPLLQSLHYSSIHTNPCIHLPLQSSLTCERGLLHQRQELFSNQKEASLPFPIKKHGLGLGGADSAPVHAVGHG